MKQVFLIDKALPVGLIANTAAALGLSLGSRIGGLVGSDALDKDNRLHVGITQVNLPMLGAAKEEIKAVRAKLYDEEYRDVVVIDFCLAAQRSRDYADYMQLLASSSAGDLDYLGICLRGPVKTINKLTGGFSLLR